MEYVIYTQQGIAFNIDSETTNLDNFMKDLNNNQLTAVSISDIGLHKRNILSIAPKEPATEKGEGVYQLNTIDRSEYLVTLEEGDTIVKVVSRINDRNQQFVKVGEVIIQAQNFDFIISVTALDEPAA